MINPTHFQNLIIRPVVDHLGLGGRNAELLLLGTALVESRLHFLTQKGTGPALGLYQMEPNTHDDIHKNFLRFRGKLNDRVSDFLSPHFDMTPQLVWNLHYATAMCRVHYARVPDALPAVGDIAGMALYWKKHYNTEKGAGHPEHFVELLRDVMP